MSNPEIEALLRALGGKQSKLLSLVWGILLSMVMGAATIGATYTKFMGRVDALEAHQLSHDAREEKMAQHGADTDLLLERHTTLFESIERRVTQLENRR